MRITRSTGRRDFWVPSPQVPTGEAWDGWRDAEKNQRRRRGQMRDSRRWPWLFPVIKWGHLSKAGAGLAVAQTQNPDKGAHV